MTCQALPPDPSINSRSREESKGLQMADTIISSLGGKVSVAVIKAQGPCNGRSWHQHTPGAANKCWELHKRCFILSSQHKGYVLSSLCRHLNRGSQWSLEFRGS